MYTTKMYKIYSKYQAAAARPGPEARAKGRPGRILSPADPHRSLVVEGGQGCCGPVPSPDCPWVVTCMPSWHCQPLFPSYYLPVSGL